MVNLNDFIPPRWRLKGDFTGQMSASLYFQTITRDLEELSVHLKDLEAALTSSLESAREAVATLETAAITIAEADHVVTIRKQLERGNELVAMAERIKQLEAEIALQYATVDEE